MGKRKSRWIDDDKAREQHERDRKQILDNLFPEKVEEMDEKLKKLDNSIFDSLSRDMKQVSNDFAQVYTGITMTEAQKRFDDLQRLFMEQTKYGSSYFKAVNEDARAQKKITGVTVWTEASPVETTTWNDTTSTFMPGNYDIQMKDQDGEPLHPDLERKIRGLVEMGKATSPDIQRILAEWNHGKMSAGDAEGSHPPQGHLKRCPYRGTHHFACTCQPPTFRGEVLLWHCDCCGFPLASVQYGLCDLCKAHEYDQPDLVKLDHAMHR